jgi:hypothetical protein
LKLPFHDELAKTQPDGIAAIVIYKASCFSGAKSYM